MKVVKLFKNGRSQAVRLPREYRFKGTEVYIKKTSSGVLLFEKDPWDLFEEGLAEISPDFLAERNQPAIQQREFENDR